MNSLTRRLISLAFTIWFIVSAAFVAVFALPGDPARMILGQRASDEAVLRFRLEAGLDEPLPVRYLKFVKRTAHLDFGDSLVQRRPVATLIQERTGITLTLVFGAIVIAFALGIAAPAFLLAAQAKWAFGCLRNTLSLLAVAPPYVLAVGAVALFAGWLGWTPAVFNPANPRCWPLPAMVLAAYPCSILLKLLETECASYGASAFARRARAYGQPSWRVFSQEIVPIAIIAPLAGFANTLAFFVTGTFFVEAVFNIPGVGGLSYEAIRNKDLPVLLAVCLLYAIAVSLISVALEGGLRIADPRIGSGRGD